MISNISNYALSAYTTQHTPPSITVPGTETKTGSNRSTNTIDNAIDFSRISGNDIRDWVNNQIKSGNMSLDDSTPFMAMTMAAPTQGNELQSDILNLKTDFVGKTITGIQGALSRNDQKLAQQLQSALDIMRKNQSGIDHMA